MLTLCGEGVTDEGGGGGGVYPRTVCVLYSRENQQLWLDSHQGRTFPLAALS
jgi:hypothetical protein